MPITYNDKEFGIEYKYQIIRPKDSNIQQKHIVFKNKEDWRKYHMEKYGYLPEFCNNWRIAKKGQWTKGDGEEEIDRGVVEILYKKEDLPHPQDKKRKEPGRYGGRKTNYAEHGYCRTVVGTFLCRPETTMTTDFNKITNRYRFDQKTKSHKFKDSVEKPDISLLEKQWLLAVSVSDYKVETMVQIWMALHKKSALKSERKFAEARINALLSKEYVMNTLLKTVEKRARDAGITPEFVIQRYYDLAKDARREDIQLSATDRCAALIGVTDVIEQRKKRMLESASQTGDRIENFGETGEVNNADKSETRDMLGSGTIEDAEIVEDENTDTVKKEKPESKSKFEAKEEKTKEKEKPKKFVNKSTESESQKNFSQYAL